jgi:hypothetical protein
MDSLAGKLGVVTGGGSGKELFSEAAVAEYTSARQGAAEPAT